MARLDGKVAIITGGTTGIGARSVEIFAGEGAKVVFCGRREDLGNALVDRIAGAVEYVRADVSVEDDVARLIQTTVGRYGRIDCLFNNAGCPAPPGSIADVVMDFYQRAMDVLITGVVHGIKHIAPVMKTQGTGSIINNGSVAGQQAGYASIIYSMAKAAVIHLTRCVAMELGESGVRVNSISPGGIATGIFGKALGLPDDKAEQTAEIVKQALAMLQPIKRAGMPDDIAYAAVFLASDESSFINARDIVVDGGLLGGRQWSVQQEGIAQMKGAFEAIG